MDFFIIIGTFFADGIFGNILRDVTYRGDQPVFDLVLAAVFAAVHILAFVFHIYDGSVKLASAHSEKSLFEKRRKQRGTAMVAANFTVSLISSPFPNFHFPTYLLTFFIANKFIAAFLAFAATSGIYFFFNFVINYDRYFMVAKSAEPEKKPNPPKFRKNRGAIRCGDCRLKQQNGVLA